MGLMSAKLRHGNGCLARRPSRVWLLSMLAVAALPSIALSAWDSFPTMSVNLAEAEASDGSVEFYKLLDGSCLSGLEDPHPVHGIQASDDSFIFSGKGFDRGGRHEGFVVKIDGQGGCVWSWTSGFSSKEDVINAVAQLPGGELLAVGFREGDGGVYSRSITKLDLATGREIWTGTSFGDGYESHGAFENVEYWAAGAAVILSGLRAKPDTEEFAFKSYGNTPGGRAIVMNLPLSAVVGSEPPIASNAIWTVTDLPVPNYEDEEVFLSTCKAAVAMPDGQVAALFFTDGGEAATTTLALLTTTGGIKWGPIELGEYGEGTDIVSTFDGQGIYLSSLSSPGISGRLTKISAADGAVLWSKTYRSVPVESSKGYLNECWGVEATADGGAILACGTGIEDCGGFTGKDKQDCENGLPISGADTRPGAVPRSSGVWQSLIVRTDENGELLWQRVDQRRLDGSPELGSPGWEETSSASEYVAITSDGGFVFVQDESGGIGILKLKGTSAQAPDDSVAGCSASCEAEWERCVNFHKSCDPCKTELERSGTGAPASNLVTRGGCVPSCTLTAGMQEVCEAAAGPGQGPTDVPSLPGPPGVPSLPPGGEPAEKPTVPTLCSAANRGACECGSGSVKTYVFWPGEQQRCMHVTMPNSEDKLPVLLSVNGYSQGMLTDFSAAVKAGRRYGFANIGVGSTVKDGAGGFGLEFPSNGVINQANPTPCSGKDSRDHAYIDTIFAFIASSEELDASRVFVEGFSQNSMFAAYIAVCWASKVAGVWQGGSGQARTGYLPITPGKQAQCSFISHQEHGNNCCETDFCTDCAVWPIWPQTCDYKVVDCLMAYTQDGIACGSDWYMYQAMVMEGNDARLLSFNEEHGAHSNPKNEFSWITGCLGIVPACSIACESAFKDCVESAQERTSWDKFAACEDDLEAGRIASCASGCAPTLGMLSLSETPVATLSEGKFGTTSGLQKHSGDAPIPDCNFGEFYLSGHSLCKAPVGWEPFEEEDGIADLCGAGVELDEELEEEELVEEEEEDEDELVEEEEEGEDELVEEDEEEDLVVHGNEEVYVIPLEVTLVDIGSVDDFPTALRNQFKSDFASAAGVPVSQVKILSIMLGSITVQTAIVVPADIGFAEARRIQSKLDDENQILPKEVFGLVTILTEDNPLKADSIGEVDGTSLSDDGDDEEDEQTEKMERDGGVDDASAAAEDGFRHYFISAFTAALLSLLY